jgi:hypothetical protein
MRALIFIFRLTALLSVIGSGGCITYLEQRTLATTESPGRDQPVSGYERDRTGPPAGAERAEPDASHYSPYIGRPLSGAAQPLAEELYAASVSRFGAAYAAAKKPRIAIYLNRVLSDEVREWITPSRIVISGKGEEVSVGSGATIVIPSGAVVETAPGAKANGSGDAERGVAAYRQTHTEDQHREKPEEVWMWQFEDNFLQPLLKAGAILVDRATILRLVAAASGTQSDAYMLEAVKQTEMRALVDHADILVELLVTRDHVSPSGYAFRATAKDTRTGMIVGSVTKTGRDYRYEKSFEAVAGPAGYEIERGSGALILENISQELAIDLMNSMSHTWRKALEQGG